MRRTPRTSIRIEDNLRNKIEQWAAKEDITAAELVRRIFEWAFGQYTRVGELALLRKMSATSQKKGKGKEAA